MAHTRNIKKLHPGAPDTLRGRLNGQNASVCSVLLVLFIVSSVSHDVNEGFLTILDWIFFPKKYV